MPHKTLTLSLASGLLLASAAAEPRPSALACNLNGIDAAERPRYHALVKTLRGALAARTELRNGYRYSLDLRKITLPETAEWIALERRCCPFLDFALFLTRAGEQAELRLTGPAGVKPLLRQEFPTGSAPGR